MTDRRLIQEYKQLLNSPPSLENPQIVELQPADVSNLYHWSATIAKFTKDDSPYYYNGQWKLDIEIDHSYPIKPPKIKFSKHTPICHPNINIDTGEICLDILTDESWSPAWNLKYITVAILMLLDSPEPDSPLNIDSANLFRHDKVGFESIVQYYIWKFRTFPTKVDAQAPADISGVKFHMSYDINHERSISNETDSNEEISSEQDTTEELPEESSGADVESRAHIQYDQRNSTGDMNGAVPSSSSRNTSSLRSVSADNSQGSTNASLLSSKERMKNEIPPNQSNSTKSSKLSKLKRRISKNLSVSNSQENIGKDRKKINPFIRKKTT